MKKVIAVAFVLVITLLFASCDTSPAIWPKDGLGAMLPPPDCADEMITIDTQYDDHFIAEIEGTLKEDFEAYIDKCERRDFIVDTSLTYSEGSGYTYYSYNEDGFRILIYYYDGIELMRVTIETPKVNDTFTWPNEGLAIKAPVPTSSVGTVWLNTQDWFSVYVGETLFEDYEEYIKRCVEYGFNQAVYEEEKLFEAKNENGDTIRVEYQGFDTMYIEVERYDEIVIRDDETSA